MYMYDRKRINSKKFQNEKAKETSKTYWQQNKIRIDNTKKGLTKLKRIL